MSQDDAVTSCQNGKLKGYVSHFQQSKKDVFVFHGIPFAEPPIGELRFMPPKPYSKKWNEIRDSSKFSNSPLTPPMFANMMGSFFPSRDDGKQIYDEDCLYLDIYTPTLDSNSNLPVMVYFYGGHFLLGSNYDYDGTALAGMNDVILVVPNYRVNIFGFLALGKNSICPGNAGLLDQHMALSWIRDNISNFGGNPENVTIFGESAGSISVNYHMTSPMTKGLFHKAIMQSGNSRDSDLETDDKSQSLEKLLEALKVTETNDEKILKLLQKVESKTLLDLLLTSSLSFKPVVDGKFIVKTPEALLNESNTVNIPTIVGYNDSEAMGIMNFGDSNYAEGLTEEQLKAKVKKFLKNHYPNADHDKQYEAIKKFYERPYSEDDKHRYSKLFGDYNADDTYIIATLKFLKANLGLMPIYCYLGAFQLKLFHDKEYSGHFPLKVDWSNCDHGDDTFLTTGFPFASFKLKNNPKFTEEEKELSRNIMTYFTNFAKSGDPNKGVVVKINWPQYDFDNFKTLKLCNDIQVIEHNQKELMEFWEKLTNM